MLINIANAWTQEKVLFVGNSLTYYNDMPTLFEGIANSKGYRVEVDSYTIGGTGLAEMRSSSELIGIIRSQSWDKVVLQPGTGESSGGSISTDSTAAVCRRIIEMVRAINPTAKVCIYEISNGVTPGEGAGDYDYYLYTQQRILDTVTQIARLAEVPLAPAGECFREHYSTHRDLLLHSTFNDIHPNLAGSYLVACAIYETLYETPVVPCDYYGGLDTAVAEYLQQIADTVVLPNRERWLMGDPDDDGTEEPLSIRETEQKTIKIYPNPTTGMVNVEKDGKVAIYDVRGNKNEREVRCGVLDLRNLAPGIYVIEIDGERQKVAVCR